MTNDVREIKEIINSYYKEIFSLENHNPGKRTQILVTINATIISEENQTHIEKNQSLGIDKLPFVFYRNIKPFFKKELE